VDATAVWPFIPGLFVMGVGVGIMLTASVNLVQSAWPEKVQGDISGVSRSVSNLGSSLGVAIAGSLIAGASASFGKPFALAIVVLGIFAMVGWVAALLIPVRTRSRKRRRAPRRDPAGRVRDVRPRESRTARSLHGRIARPTAGE
jgi:MFS family permease